MTVARLGYEIDSSGAVVAADNLDDMAAAAKRAEVGSKGLTGGAGKAGKALGGVTFNARMLVPQLSQIGQQFTATGQLGQAVAVQAADIGLAFGVVGTVIGTVAGVALPSLIAALSDGSNEADVFADRLDSLNNIMSNLSDSQTLLELSTDELTQRFGFQAEVVRNLIQDLAQYRISIAADALKEQAELAAIATSEFVNLSRQVKASSDMIDTIRAAGSRFAQDRIDEVVADIAAEAQVMGDKFGISADEAIQLSNAFADLNNATGADAQRQALADLNDLMDELGVSTEQIPSELNEAIARMAELGILTAELETTMARVAANASMMNFGVGLSPDDPNLLPPTGGSGGGDGDGDGRRRGGGGSRVDEFARDLERLRESLRTEQEVVSEWYLDQQELLNNQRAQEILGIEGHNDAKLRLEQEYQERLSEIEGSGLTGRAQMLDDFFGEASGLMQSGNEKLFKIGQAAAVANAVVNGHSAAVAAWEKGMQAGGPPLAAAYTALSLARTGAQIAAISSASSSGGAGSASSAGVTATSAAAPAPQRQDAVIQLEGALADVIAPLMNSIVSELQSQSEDGVNIVSVTAR